MQPKKKIIDRAIENGSMKRVNMLLSAAHLLMCEVSNLVGETSDVLRDNGLMLGEIKKHFGVLDKDLDLYFNEFTKMVDTPERGKDLFNDCDEFDKMFRKWAKLK